MLARNKKFIAKKEAIDNAIDNGDLVKLLIYIFQFGVQLISYIRERKVSKADGK